MIAVHWIDRSDHDQSESDWRARRAASRALVADTAGALGVDPVSVKRRARGKPVLSPPGLHYSMSHSGSLSICAVADDHVGIDLELLDAPRTARLAGAIPLRFFTERERQAIAADPAALLRIFTGKEAWVKHQGVGLGAGLGGFDRESVRDLHPGIAFSDFDLPGAASTVCHTRGERPAPVRRHLTARQIARGSELDRQERAL